MSGYIGATVVGLDTTAADVTGDITASDTSPELTLKNSTHEDTDGGREGKITFKGEQSGGEESTLAQIQASHDGASDDEKGDLIFKTNDGNDGASPTERLRLDSAGDMLLSSPDPSFTITNTTHEDTDGGRESTIVFKGEQSGGELSTLAEIEASHDGTADDEKGDLIFRTNDGSDGSSPTEAMRITSQQRLGIGTDSPDTMFHVSGGNARIAGTETSGSFIDINASNTGSDGASLGVSYYGSGSYGPLKISTGGSERMRIANDGDVGIGTSSPTSKLMITDEDGGQPMLSVRNFATSATGSFANTYNMEFRTCTSGGQDHGMLIHHNENNINRRVLEIQDSNGTMAAYANAKILIGKTTNATSTAGHEIRTSGSDTGRTNVAVASEAFYFYDSADGSQVGYITHNGSGTTYGSGSDYRLKENITDISDGITRVKQLQPRRFNFIKTPDATVDGFIAHEAQTVVPEAVSGTHNEVDDDGNAVMQGIDQSKLVPLLTAALQEAIAKIETLETKVAALEGA